jgi:MATE family multidrug resistance protein
MTAEAFQADLHRPALSLPKTYSGEARASLALATPIAATQLLWMAVGVADVMMVARLGADALAAIALATAAYYMLFWPSMGFVNAVSPVSAQAIGADPNGLNRLLRSEETNARLRIALRMGIWMGVAVSIPVIAVMLHANTILLALGQEPHLAEMAANYIYARLPAAPLMGAFMSMRMLAASLERTGPALWIAGLMLVTNVFLNWVLIYGNLGAPAMGITGAAIASAISEVIGLGAMILVYLVDRDFVSFRPFLNLLSFHAAQFRELARLGWPIALSWTFEAGLFNSAVILMGWISTAAVAGQMVAMNVASLTFMVPMALGSAATVRVGYGIGARNMEAARRAGHVSIGLAAVFMLAMAAIIWTVPSLIVAAYLDLGDSGNAAAAKMALGFLAIAALFQLFDGMQVTAMGALRGLKDTRVPMLIAGLAYWVLAFPAGAALAFWAGWGGYGIWWGFVIGLSIAAVLMTWRFEYLTHRNRGAAEV